MIENTEFYTEVVQGMDSKLAVIAENEMILTEQASLLRKEYESRRREIDRIIQEICDDQVKKVYERVGSMITTQRRLWTILASTRVSGHEEDRDHVLAGKKEINDLIRRELDQIERTYLENSEYIDKIEDDWKGVKKASIEGVKLAKEIDWEAIPEEELGRRLRGGEVLHRDEWIPTQDNSTGRKLSPSEFKSHLEFGEMILREARACFEKQDLELSYTRYTQGVELLSWVRGPDSESESQRLDMYKRFLKNQALLALKLGKYNDSIQSCNKVLSIDECDEKSLFRRGECYMMLGRYEEAKKDFRFICEFDYFSRDAKLQSRRRLVEMIKRSKSSNYVNKSIISNLDGLMQEDRRPEGQTRPPAPHPRQQDPHRLQSDDQRVPTSRPAGPRREAPPRFDLETTKDILDELLFKYSSEDFEKQLFELRRLSDYDEKRFLRRLRSVLPAVTAPVFEKYGLDLESMSYDKAKRILEESVSYWRTRDDQVKALSREIYKYIMGDTIAE
ncbi:TPR domain-containing protein [Cryptosporidium canis]|uniref:TPR domain-containing protein n=1 Tax=Cryptosporidium canis TaxID=195482 RepID=A0ABQ8PAF6_9CRYT|nr:TPR domain-containing protein [Cryptosporidium canis]KAJ1614350.1 TPR domain-containing protein [Cryptosporidium canis]